MTQKEKDELLHSVNSTFTIDKRLHALSTAVRRVIQDLPTTPEQPAQKEYKPLIKKYPELELEIGNIIVNGKMLNSDKVYLLMELVDKISLKRCQNYEKNIKVGLLNIDNTGYARCLIDKAITAAEYPEIE